MPWARRWVRIVTCDISKPFCFNFTCSWRSVRLGFRENKFTIILSSFFFNFSIDPNSGKSSIYIFFVALYRWTHFCTNCFDFPMYLAAVFSTHDAERVFLTKDQQLNLFSKCIEDKGSFYRFTKDLERYFYQLWVKPTTLLFNRL